MLEWLRSGQSRNALDEAVLTYPSTEVYAAYEGEKILGYQVVQPVMILDSFAANPEASPFETATAMVEILKCCAHTAHRSGAREIMFLHSDANTTAAAELVGFKAIAVPVLRLRLEA